MSAKHTPGPWSLRSAGSQARDYAIVTAAALDRPSSGRLATVHYRDGYDIRANADLIAASPALLAALINAREVIRTWHGNIAWAEYQRSPEMAGINAAIAAATGSSP
jgi:hypothetical protein